MNLKDEFERIARRDIDREGLEPLLRSLSETDFYTAPASTRFHNSFEGGLVLHSLNVYRHLRDLCIWYDCHASVTSQAIVALFHDICKVGVYKTESRWRKDAQNKWVQYQVYTFKEDFPFGGHGSKSVYLLQQFMTLTPIEAAAINCHMGQHDATIYSDPSPVYETNKLAWLLHVADEAETYLTKEDNNET